MNILYVIIYVIIGFIMGWFSLAFACQTLIFGTLKTAYDGDEPYLFLDMDKRPEELAKRKLVIFRVQNVPIKDPQD